jgi:phosphoribosylamine--glycine ligase
LLEAAEGRLGSVPLHVAPGAAVGVVLAAEGYPGTPVTGTPIHGLEGPAGGWSNGVTVFHAGTRLRDGHIVTSGGRVVTVVARAATHATAMADAYAAVAAIHFEGMQYRTDIGKKALQ